MGCIGRSVYRPGGYRVLLWRGGLNVYPANLFFVPYYGLAIIAFFGHIAAIHSKAMKKDIARLSPQRQAKLIFVFGIVLTIIIFYGLTDGFQGVEIPPEFYSFENIHP